jgi:hypothetical protein
MTAYKKLQTPQSLTPSASVQETKAKRQAELRRVRKQRAVVYKRMAQEWMQDGMIIKVSELKKR